MTAKKTMKAMVLFEIGKPLLYVDVPYPIPNDNQVLIKVEACGICRTDLHILDGELSSPKLPLIPGHQIVGKIKALGKKVNNLCLDQRIGVPWLGSTCQACQFCLNHQENLCDHAQFTGYQINGGLAEYCIANSQFCFPISNQYSSQQAAPLLCAGLIGYRAYRKIKHAKHIGLYGFGAAAHILIQVAKFYHQSVYAFTRAKDDKAQEFARSLGAAWAGDSLSEPPVLLDAAIIFAPIGELVLQALKVIRKGGQVICAGIHMSDIPSFPYKVLWEERSISSIANLTREDGYEFLTLAPQIPIKTEVTCYPLKAVNDALSDLKNGKLVGAGVITID